ncbi:macrophage mannose receptor 1 [Trichonephila clavata]|uniref:Macrophage mannose receptor 1 n=1 Tax=Trichonephila clavata TaxID=2740835 RepID=A0A8X6FBE1_TRICU|nr:macrophage mannose receptor 1 [Trichonephila clavata]
MRSCEFDDETKLLDAVSTFSRNWTMVDDQYKYWTELKVVNDSVVTPSGTPGLPLPLEKGKGECVTVSFHTKSSTLNAVDAQLHQTDCKDHAHVMCAAPSLTFNSSLSIPTYSPPLQQQMLSCPPGQNWKVYPITNTCFWETSFETSRLSWSEARKYCQAYGGDLASFHNVDEEKIGLSFQYGSLSHPYWIGLYLDPETGTYKWSDGSPLNYQNWAPGHPNHRDKRLGCVAMDADATHWMSSFCGIVSWFVCKAPKVAYPPAAIIPTREPLIPCDGSFPTSRYGAVEIMISGAKFYYYKGYCYSVVSSLYNWHRAKQFCEDKGASLASIHSDEEIEFLLRLLYDNRQGIGNRVWIGLNSLRSGILRWSDYSPLDYTYWNEDEPNNNNNQEKCVNMYIGNGLWNDENCNNAMGFICKLNKDSNETVEIPTTRDPTIGNCKKGWYAHRDRCYLPVGFNDIDKANWTDASEICQHMGATLVSIRNVQDQVYLSYLMQGLKDDVWIGLSEALSPRHYSWVDNSELRYTNWAPGEPSFFGIQEDCVKMVYDDLDSGVWRDDVCMKKYPYICQMDKNPDLPKPDYNRGLDCIFPSGWLKLDDMCFKMFSGNPLSWYEAEESCKRQGAHLVSLSGTSIQAIASYLGVEVNQTYWIGLAYERSTQKFKWLNSWPMTISKWGENEPSHVDRDEVCFSSAPDGFWRKTSCKEQLPYICHITAGKPPNPKAYAGDCPKTSDLWAPTEGSYCLIYENTVADWFSATLRCLRYASHLVSIHSLEELEQVRKAIQKPGMQSQFLLTSLMRSQKGGFAWMDMSPVDFVNWEEGQPDEGDDHCVALMVDTLKWRVVSCLGRTQLLCSARKEKEIEGVPESAKYYDDSESGLPIGALIGILVCTFVVVIIIILGIIFFRPTLGRSRFRNPFRQHSVSYENALYNVDSASMEFQPEEQTSS